MCCFSGVKDKQYHELWLGRGKSLNSIPLQNIFSSFPGSCFNDIMIRGSIMNRNRGSRLVGRLSRLGDSTGIDILTDGSTRRTALLRCLCQSKYLASQNQRFVSIKNHHFF